MKIISTKAHGYIDYIMGIMLLVSPSLFNLDMENIQSIILYVAGATIIFYSLLTSYEVGIIKVIPMKIHLILDILSGFLLAASPWIYGFSEIVYAPYLVLGLLEICAALMTSSKPMIEIKTYNQH